MSRSGSSRDNGYSGARVDDMAALMRTTKRMIYYYYGGKEKLYVTVCGAKCGRSRYSPGL